MKQLYLLGLLLVSFSNMVFSAEVEGKVVWSQRITMSTTVSGIVEQVLFEVGDRVKKGEVLLRLQAARFKALLNSAKASKNDAKYKLKEAEREWDRAQELYERTVLSDRDLQQAENALITARASFAKASAQYINAQRDLYESVIRAPFDALILERHVEVGQTVITTMRTVPMISLATSKVYHAVAVISLEDANKLKAKQNISVMVNNKNYNGVLASIGFEKLKSQDGYPITVKFSAGDSLLRAGETAVISLP